ncbi:MAG TPA: PQQ-binding-like beta-propeller repeat protein [Steroidobacteraceae bacterium]|nr:PQQ-binding-like beta-propeller repeat protein [Steroidobacteraceae bacterium]
MKRILFLLAPVWLATAQTANPQGTFHSNIARTGVYPSAGPKQLNGVKWAFKSGGPILGSPAIAAGVVYIGSLDGFVYAVDQETGKEKWKHATHQPVVSSPAVSGGLVFFEGYDGVLYALATDTGTVKWYFVAEYERRFEAKHLHGYSPESQTIPDSWDLYLSSPAVFNNHVYFGSGDGNVYAVDTSTGVLHWKFSTGDIVHASPAIANGTVYIGSWDSNLYALDAESGQEKWRFKGGEDPVVHNQVGFQSSPAVVDGVVYTGCRDGHVYALDANTGRKKWDYSTAKNWVNATPAVRDGVVYAGTSFGWNLHALDARTGRERFTFHAGGEIFSSAALAGDLAYFGAANGRLYAIDAKTGKLAWQFQTEASKADPMKVLKPDGSLDDEAIFAHYFHDSQDMALAMYRMFSVGGVWSSPAVDKGVVYFGSTDGYLYALH